MAKKKLPKEIREMFVSYGRLGGKIGGKIRTQSMTPDERKALAKKAAKARWKKAKGS